MDSPDFRVVEHSIPCSYIREYPNATKGQRDDAPLRLAIKQYQPIVPVLDNEPNSVTIIGAHATGIPKEAYEPLWDELHRYLKPAGTKIRGIWIADMSNHGESGLLNEHIQGDDPSWFDLSRDLQHMVNVFRDEIKRPIIGVAHSIGATVMTKLSLMHPRLFAGLAFIEPMLQQDVPLGPVFAAGSTMRKDLWSTRREAEAALKKSRMISKFDQRVVLRMSQYTLRAVPTAIYPLSGDVKDGALTLTTSKHQEVWSFLRPNFAQSTLTENGTISPLDRLLAPDVDHKTTGQYLFFRPEFGFMFTQLPHLRPRVLYVFGEKSPMSTGELQAAKVNATGIGTGGSGGVGVGQVESHCVPKSGHMLPCENVQETAETVGRWMVGALDKWRGDELILRTHDAQKSDRDGLVVSAKWIEMTKNEGTARRPRAIVAKTKL